MTDSQELYKLAQKDDLEQVKECLRKGGDCNWIQVVVVVAVVAAAAAAAVVVVVRLSELYRTFLKKN